MLKRYSMLFLLSMLFCLAAGAGEKASSSTTIQPLLIGASIPSVSLTDLEGKPVDLAEEIKTTPSILVFYRGGW